MWTQLPVTCAVDISHKSRRRQELGVVALSCSQKPGDLHSREASESQKSFCIKLCGFISSRWSSSIDWMINEKMLFIRDMVFHIHAYKYGLIQFILK